VLTESPCERIGKLETCPILKEDRSHSDIAGASVIKTATLLGVSRANISEVMSAYMNHGKTMSAKRNSGKINIDKKRSPYIEKDYFKIMVVQHR
jgi:hypothetical protein